MTSRDDSTAPSPPGWTNEPHREPEHLLGQVLARTARTRAPSRLAHPRKVDLHVSHQFTGREPLWACPGGRSALAALLTSRLIAGAVLVAGSLRQSRVAPPFGPAANGRCLLLDEWRPDGRRLTDGGHPRIDHQGLQFGVRFGSAVLARTALRLVFVRGQMDSDAMPRCGRRTPTAHVSRLLDRDAADRVGGVVAAGTTWSRSRSTAISSVIRMVSHGRQRGVTDIKTGLPVALNPIFRPSDGGSTTFRGQATDGTGASTSSTATARDPAPRPRPRI